MNKYIRLNNNDNHLSLGNLFNEIKKISKNKSSAIQTEIFCLLFDIENISTTTVNNYCIGCRSIHSEYKQIYLNYQKKYFKNKTILVQNINNICSLMDGYIYNYQNIEELNNLECLKKLTINLYRLAKNDLYVQNKLKKEIFELINSNNYYDALARMLFFIILEKKQPIYESEEIKETIENIIDNTNLSINDLKDFLKIKFEEGINYVHSLKNLAKKNNPCALHELGNLEYKGEIAGYPRYDLAYRYYLKASNYEYPSSCFMIGYMIINKKIGNLEDNELNLAWKYLQKAESLGSISAINTIGFCYKEGYTKDRKRNIKLAITYFNKAIEKKYIYAYNNLGKIYEDNKEYEQAFKNYLLAADMEESWACNKIGEFYRLGIGIKKDINKSYEYYQKGLLSPITNRCYWNNYNLVKYFYLFGNVEIGIEKNLDKCLSLLQNNKNFIYSQELLLYVHYELYLKNKTKSDLNKAIKYLEIVNESTVIDKKRKQDIFNYLTHEKQTHIKK